MYSRAFAIPRLALLSFAILISVVSVRAQQSGVEEPARPTVSILDSTREQDGLSGPVRRVHTEMSKLSVNTNKAVEEPRMLLEVTTYDPQGKRIWNVYYPVNTDSFKGNQEFTYDAQGHVREMTLKDDSGRIINRESYTYDFDRFGNWTRMTSSLVIFEGGKLVYEPFETTYRAISYYYDDSVAQIVKSATSPTGQTVSAPAGEVKGNTTSAAIIATSGEPQGTLNQQSSNKSEDAVARTPTSSSPNVPAQTNETPTKTPSGEQSQAKRNVEVTASSEQAYSIPAAPISTSKSSKPTVSGGVVTGKILSLPKPIYPKDAMVRGVYGKVVVEITVDEQGRVIDARALSGNPILRVSAVWAARLARFEPTLLSGQPVKSTKLIDYDFKKP